MGSTHRKSKRQRLVYPFVADMLRVRWRIESRPQREVICRQAWRHAV